MTRAVLALAVSAFGWVLSAVAASVALVGQTSPPGGDLAAWATGGGATAAVGGLVYMARLLATGRLVARDPARVESKLIEIADKLTEIARQSSVREDGYRDLLMQWARPQSTPAARRQRD